jgi:hypothetical protein
MLMMLKLIEVFLTGVLNALYCGGIVNILGETLPKFL